MTAPYPRFAAEDLRRFTAQVLMRLEVPEEDAALAAEALVHSDLLGIDTHGVAHLPDHKSYVVGLRDGSVNPRPRLRVLRETATTAVLDGDGGMGVVVAPRAMALAMEKAAAVGCGFVAIRNGRHFGAAAHYSLMAAARDMIGIAMTNGRGFQMAPTFGREPRLATNPISVAAPTREGPPFMMDIATTVVAGGKLEQAVREGRSVPEGWILDKHGRPTTNPHDFFDGGTILPLGGRAETGGYKGYALAVMVDVFSGVLSGVGSSAMLSGRTQGIFLGAWQVEAFMPAEEFKAMLSEALRLLRETPPAEGYQRVYTPGEREWLTFQERSRLGIPLHPAVVERLRAVGEELGVPLPPACQ